MESLAQENPSRPATAQNVVEQFSPSAAALQKIIVIGAGPAGMRFTKELLKRQPLAKITVFGNEPSRPYNRIQLSSLLAGEVEYDDIITDLPNESDFPGFNFEISRITSISTEKQFVVDAYDNKHFYDKLIIATGARPHKPNIPGFDQQGVYTFRNLKDTEFLFSRMSRARHIVVVGGGLLGIEAARALLRFNTKVTLIQQSSRLMNRQLDDHASSILEEKVKSFGINVITNSGVRQITGDGRVTGVITRDKTNVVCDTVLVCAGIKPNFEIARNAKIKVAHGIIVNDQLETSATNVYAIGECSEHRGLTYGLVNPGYEQAAVCADVITGGQSHYQGSLEVSRLKVIGDSLCSMGQVADVQKRPRLFELIFKQKSKNFYRKLVIHRSRIIGAVAYGEWEESRRIQECYQNNRRIWPWQYLWFLLTGRLFFGEGGSTNVNNWPLEAVICQCNNITHGDIVDAIDHGNNTVKKIQESTTASTVCGSCKPIVEQLLGDSAPRDKEKGWILTSALSILAIAIAMSIVFLPESSKATSVQNVTLFESIWSDKYWKQVTGFSLLGLSLLGLIMSLRKRLKIKFLGEFNYWRILHIALGVLAIATLIFHTGLHLGENFNRYLMVNFLSIVAIGALAGISLSLGHLMSTSSAIKLRRFWTWTHILITWPLPVLLAIHIVTVYYF